MQKLRLRPEQKEALNFIGNRRKAALFLPMGYGKTAITLAAIQGWREQGWCKQCVIIAPPQVAKYVWAQEAAKWEQFQDMKVVVLTGTPKQRMDKIAAGADIFVISSSLTAWFVKHSKLAFDTLIVDESTHFKSPSSKRFKALRYSTVKHMKQVVILTGTPAPNGMEDLWSQIFLLDEGRRLERTMGKYRERYFIMDLWSNFPVYRLRKGYDTLIQKRIDDIVMSADKMTLATLPDLSRLIVECEKPGKQFQEDYEAMYKDMVATIGDTEIGAANAAVKIAKMSQMCNGCVYDEDKNTIVYHDNKLRALEQLREADEPMIVVYSTVADKERILKHFAGCRIAALSRSGKEVEMWNKGELDMLVLHPAAAGHGLNLQYGGSVLVWHGLTYNLEHYQQMCARLHRQGQKDAVRIYHIVMPDISDDIKSIDRVILEALANKDDLQEGLLAAMSHRLTGGDKL